MSEQKTMIIVGLFITSIILFFLYKRNDGSSQEKMADVSMGDVISMDGMTRDITDATLDDLPQQVSYNRQNPDGILKKSSYRDGTRGQFGTSEWVSAFETNNTVLGTNMPKKVTGIIEDNLYAPFKSDPNVVPIARQETDIEKLYDINAYLPGETNDKWFDVPEEPIGIEDRKLINVIKPIGTISSGTRRNATLDIRGTPSCPKISGISPWNQSSIEPDINIKGLSQ